MTSVHRWNSMGTCIKSVRTLQVTQGITTAIAANVRDDGRSIRITKVEVVHG